MPKTIKNLVFKGGGVRGIGYVGALQQSESLGLLKHVQRVAGTSAGAITALLIALGYSPAEIKTLMWEMDFNKFKDKRNFAFFKAYDLFFKLGLCKGDYFFNWISECILKKTGSRTTTFKQLAELAQISNYNFKLLYVYVTNLSSIPKTYERISHEIDTEWTLAEAVRASMAIPGFYRPVIKNGCTYVDGGLYKNYPLDAFDNTYYLGQDFTLADGTEFTNPETLGFRLDDKNEIEVFRGLKPPRIELVNDLYNTVRCLIEAAINSEDADYFANLRFNIKFDRSVYCDTLGVSTIDFSLNENTKTNLIIKGEEGIVEYYHRLQGQQPVAASSSLMQEHKTPVPTLMQFNASTMGHPLAGASEAKSDISSRVQSGIHA